MNGGEIATPPLPTLLGVASAYALLAQIFLSSQSISIHSTPILQGSVSGGRAQHPIHVESERLSSRLQVVQCRGLKDLQYVIGKGLEHRTSRHHMLNQALAMHCMCMYT